MDWLASVYLVYSLVALIIGAIQSFFPASNQPNQLMLLIGLIGLNAETERMLNWAPID